MKQHAHEELVERCAELRREALRGLNCLPEGLFRGGEGKGFELLSLAAGAAAQKYVLPEIGHKDQAIFVEVLLHLFALGNLPGVRAWRFDLDDAARGDQALCKWVGNRGLLVRGDESAVRESGADASGVNNAPDAWFELFASGAEQVREIGIVGRFLDGHAAQARVAQLREESLYLLIVQEFRLSHYRRSEIPGTVFPHGLLTFAVLSSPVSGVDRLPHPQPLDRRQPAY